MISIINDLVWSKIFIGLCLFCGFYFSIRLGFLQFTHLRTMVKLLFQKPHTSKGISPFQAFALAISGRVGTGNIIGVATAIAMGGPGAVFWMWIIAIIGAASAFAEATLGQLYKTEINGEYKGGPAYYILNGMQNKWYAILFAVITIISCGFLLPGVQSNSIASSISTAFPEINFTLFDGKIQIVGLLIMALLGIIIFGGVRRLAKASEIVVPFMAFCYIAMAIVIIGLNIEKLPEVFTLIFKSAFAQEAAFSGIIGSAIAWGIKRGIYSNEAGQGTAPHAAAASEVNHPAEQGLVQAFSVYIDTIFVCTATALMILFTNSYNVIDETNQALIVNHLPNLDYTTFTQNAVSHHFPTFGKQFVAMALFFFAFTTIMAYYYYAESNISFLFKKNKNPIFLNLFRILFLIAMYFGTIYESKQAWAIGDIGVGLMAWVNLIALLYLRNVVIKVWKDYKSQKKLTNQIIQFNAEKLGIPHTDFWK